MNNIDIDILEKFCEIKINRYAMKFVDISYPDLQQAISTLIAENKELKEENKKLTDEYMIQKHLINAEFLDDYIPKSKVEELQNKYKTKIEKLESKKIWNEPVDTINKNRYVNYYNAYEELLGKE